MKSIPKIERDGYLITSHPDLVPSTKILPNSYRVGSGERMLNFGELQIYGTLICEGQVDVQLGTPYSYILNTDLLFDTSLYGVVVVDGIVTQNVELNII